MYKITRTSEQAMPQLDQVFSKLILHPKLHAESKILICYIISEHGHNPMSQFQKNIFQRTANVKRQCCDKALLQLLEKDIIKRYRSDEGETVYDLDWDILLDYLEDQTIVIKSGRSQFMSQFND